VTGVAGDTSLRRRPLLGALLAGAFVLAAVALEMVSGLNANSQVPAWAAKAVPLAWPQPARVAWWLAVAGAMGTFRFLLGRAGIPQRRLVVIVSVTPFVLFAAGVAVGADWATWH
jgi:hypothetical protein